MADEEELYSLRMRASTDGRHVSGAERIVPAGKIDIVAQELIGRALKRTAPPEQIVVKADALKNVPIQTLTALDVVTLDIGDYREARTAAKRTLEKAGVSSIASDNAVACLSHGPAPSGRNMRGAVLMDRETGRRLEPDRERGVRASRFDWTDEALDDIRRKLRATGLTHHRTWEALALATKVVYARGVIAELCWSDDPGYTAGYVASRRTGYVRFPQLKQEGDSMGGRVFFVDNPAEELESLIRYLQTEPVLITATGECRAAVAQEEYFRDDFD